MIRPGQLNAVAVEIAQEPLNEQYLGGQVPNARTAIAAYLNSLLADDEAMERGRVAMWMTACDLADFRQAFVDAVTKEE